ncbi:hypothetical protein [Pseudophaeobacter sp.]|uniref:hypothetical protein n=1 Tax=Pseudophaeobacter sp. TaxID=1971739 RepID=UPI0032982F19
MKKQPILCVTTGSSQVNKNWFPGALSGQEDGEGGFLFTREQAEKFTSYWTRAAQDVLEAREIKSLSFGGIWSKMKGRDVAYVTLDGRNINMIFRTLDTEPTLHIKAGDSYKLRVDVVLLALDVLADAVHRAQENEPLGYAKEPETALGGMLGGNNTFLKMLRSSADMDRQNKAMLEAYGGKWPDKTQTRAGQYHLDHLREIALNRCDLKASLDRLMGPLRG